MVLRNGCRKQVDQPTRLEGIDTRHDGIRSMALFEAGTNRLGDLGKTIGVDIVAELESSLTLRLP